MTRKLSRRLKTAVVLVAVGIMAGPVCRAADPRPIQWTAAAKTTQLPLRKGAAVQVTLHAKILAGWHLYAMEQEPGGPTATRINLAPNQAFALNGSIESETPPIITNDPNFNLETRYFEGEASFHIPVKVMSSTSGAQATLMIDVLFQTCNDRMCLPATVVHVSAPIQRGR